jgi:hypothetical protein
MSTPFNQSNGYKLWEKIKNDFLGILLGALLFSGGIHLFNYGVDSTDDLNGSRSGMTLHVDFKTGCHYLVRGGITPRLDKDGSHICVGIEE